MFREGLNKSARADVEEICDRKRRETAANPDGFQGFTTNLWRKLTDRCRRRIQREQDSVELRMKKLAEAQQEVQHRQHEQADRRKDMEP